MDTNKPAPVIKSTQADTRGFISSIQRKYCSIINFDTVTEVDSTSTQETAPRGHLLKLSHEIIHEILQYVYPQDLASLAQTCSAFSSYIKNNRLLWRAVYLHNFDQPQDYLEKKEPNWEQDAKDIVTTFKICLRQALGRTRPPVDDASLELSAKTIIRLATTARVPDKSNKDKTQSRNLRMLQFFLKGTDNYGISTHGSNLYRWAYGEPESRSPELSQLLAKVHCLAGIASDSLLHTRRLRPTRSGSPSMTPASYARARVYDLRKYNQANQWGPWSDDGAMTVDWEKVECIMIDLGFNVEVFTAQTCTVLKDLWREPFAGVQPNSYVPSHCQNAIQVVAFGSGQDMSANNTTPAKYLTEEQEAAAAAQRSLVARDPYGITGAWQRIVCFLDYSNFYYHNFNSNPPLSQHRDPTNYEEAIRLILMELTVDSIEQVPGSDWPKVHFQGMSRSLHAGWDPNANSRITGTVEMTPEHEVRWSTLSHFQGVSRWRSEGVQVGGVKSARGVIGTWFDKDHDRNGPCGPTAFWKISDTPKVLRHGSSRANNTTEGSGLHNLAAYGIDSDDSENEDDEEYEPHDESEDDEEEDEEDDDGGDTAGEAEIEGEGGGVLEEEVEVDFQPIEQAALFSAGFLREIDALIEARRIEEAERFVRYEGFAALLGNGTTDATNAGSSGEASSGSSEVMNTGVGESALEAFLVRRGDGRSGDGGGESRTEGDLDELD